MNHDAEQHLAKAANYVVKGEEFYRKAAEEILAAKEADSSLTNPEIASRIGKGHAYVSRLIQAGSRARDGGEFVIDWGSGSNERATITRKMLEEATPEKLEAVVAELPAKQQAALAASALRKAEPRRMALERLSSDELTEVGHDAEQLHPATAKRAPLGMPEARTYGFTMEMIQVSGDLRRAIDAYVEKWEEVAEDASEEELQTERDLIAPKMLRLRMTVEEVAV